METNKLYNEDELLQLLQVTSSCYIRPEDGAKASLNIIRPYLHQLTDAMRENERLQGVIAMMQKDFEEYVKFTPKPVMLYPPHKDSGNVG